jgi:hypothetical protein
MITHRKKSYSYEEAEATWTHLIVINRYGSNYTADNLIPIIRELSAIYPQLVNIRGGNGFMMLHRYYYIQEVTFLLLELGADPNMITPGGDSVLDLIIRNGACHDITKLLLSIGAKFGKNLDVNIEYISTDMYRMLITYGLISWDTYIARYRMRLIELSIYNSLFGVTDMLLWIGSPCIYYRSHFAKKIVSAFENAWFRKGKGSLMYLDQGVAFPLRIISYEADGKSTTETLSLLYSFVE